MARGANGAQEKNLAGGNDSDDTLFATATVTAATAAAATTTRILAGIRIQVCSYRLSDSQQILAKREELTGGGHCPRSSSIGDSQVCNSRGKKETTVQLELGRTRARRFTTKNKEN